MTSTIDMAHPALDGRSAERLAELGVLVSLMRVLISRDSARVVEDRMRSAASAPLGSAQGNRKGRFVLGGCRVWAGTRAADARPRPDVPRLRRGSGRRESPGGEP